MKRHLSNGFNSFEQEKYTKMALDRNENESKDENNLMIKKGIILKAEIELVKF
jgi:hypothetical protein